MSNLKVDINMSICDIPCDNNNCTMLDETYTNVDETDRQIIPKKRTTIRKRKKKRSRPYCSICMKYFATQGSRKIHMVNTHHDNEKEQTNFFNISHINSFQNNSVPNKCQIKMNEQSTNSILPLNDSCIEPLDQQLGYPIESNKIDTGVSEKVSKSILFDQQLDTTIESNKIHTGVSEKVSKSIPFDQQLDNTIESNKIDTGISEKVSKSILFDQQLDTTIESNKIHTGVSEKVSKSIPFDQQLDNTIESNEIHTGVSEKVNKSIPKRRISKRKNTKSGSTYCNICKKNYSTPASCKTHMYSYHGNRVSNKCEIEMTKLFKKSLNPSNKPNPNNILKEVGKNEHKTKNQMKRKNNKICSCSICKKKFSTMRLYKIHMSRCHNNKVSKKLVRKKPFTKYLPQIKFIKNEIFNEFESEMPLEFWCDNEKYRCNICNAITTDKQDLMEHEKVHYQNIDDVKYDMFGKIQCNTCQCVFTTLDYEEHKHEDCKNLDYKISKSHINTEPIAQIVENEEHDLLPVVGKLLVLSKDSVAFDNEEHIKALQTFSSVRQTFECVICQETCNKPEHLECHQWWSSPDENNQL